jgi:hypothetical protein
MGNIIKMIFFFILGILTLTLKNQDTFVIIARLGCFFMAGWYLGGIFRIKKEEK